MVYRLRDLSVDQSEIVFPLVIVAADFPFTIDTVAVLGEVTGKALAKIQRGEVGSVSVELPDPLMEGHRIETSNSSIVKIVLRVCVAPRVSPDDGDALGRAGFEEFGSLSKEASPKHPLKGRSPDRAGGPAPGKWASIVH